MRISNSFSEDEIQVLDFITQTLLRGGTPTMATRNKAYPSLCRKVMAMKAKVNELKQRAVREESSVGTVASPNLSHEVHGGHGASNEALAVNDTAEAAEAHDHDDHNDHNDIAAAV